jgi:ribosomal protein S4E
MGVNAGSKIRLVDVKLSVDDQIVSYHAYSEQETVALSKGGLHRLFMGNVNSGTHSMQAVVTAYDANGKDFQRTVNYSFSKNSLRKIVEIKASNDSSNAQPALFSFREWESKN